HSTGYKLANDGADTRSLAHYLGHRNDRQVHCAGTRSICAVLEGLGHTKVCFRWYVGRRVAFTESKGKPNAEFLPLNDAVIHRGRGPRGRVQVEEPKIYTIVRCMPMEADGRLRYRIKSGTIERVVTEDELSYLQ